MNAPYDMLQYSHPQGGLMKQIEIVMTFTLNTDDDEVAAPAMYAAVDAAQAAIRERDAELLAHTGYGLSEAPQPDA